MHIASSVPSPKPLRIASTSAAVRKGGCILVCESKPEFSTISSVNEKWCAHASAVTFIPRDLASRIMLVERAVDT